MPELPEVQTTVSGINKLLLGLKIKKVWSDYHTPLFDSKQHIKSKNFFEKIFKKKVIGTKIVKAERLGKNVLINLDNNNTILIHMKMTGHLMYGKYKFQIEKNQKHKENWVPAEDGPLKDPFNRFIHLVFVLSNGKSLVLSDMRKFAKITLIEQKENSDETSHIGPDPLSDEFSLKIFSKQILKKPNGKIKSVLMEQSIISGIGNIYSDEILWQAGIKPDRMVKTLKTEEIKNIFKNISPILKKSIKLGGDSMSDYRNIFGEKGKFQNFHLVYRKTGEQCSKKGCHGIIERKKIGGRSAHFCPIHQK